MAFRNSNCILAIIAFCYFVRLINTAADSLCPGPLAYYEALGCKPIFNNSNDECAERYDCDFLKTRSLSQCTVNGHSYEIGERLKEEDANPCDIGCTCTSTNSGIASFTCAVVDCFNDSPKPGCYRKRSPLNCCDGEEVCPTESDPRATCLVNGTVYEDGEYFSVPEDPDLSCICQPGYTGSNVEPFCAKPKHPYCSPTFRNAGDVVKNCAPVYYSSQSPQTSCSVFNRCQNENDTVIHSTDNSSESPDPDMQCYFGNMTMGLGDELNQATDYSVCVKCVCEVPPTPTCQRLPDDECDVTKHPPFKNS